MSKLKYSIDTRTIQPGECFVAIRGERYDGHDFIPKAIEKGAIALVVDRAITVFSNPTHIPVSQVEDSLLFLATKARKRIDRLQPDVIAVTGSVGKTTTKNAIATVLRQAFPVVASKGNWNTLLGLSLTIINELTSEKQKLVVEVGTYQRGSIAQLCSFIPPTISVVTNIHPVHLERMGTIKNITLAKQELVEALTMNGTACLNWDDPRVRAMADQCKGQVLLYGQRPGADITPEHVTVDIPLSGSYKIYPALAAFCVGLHLGLSDNVINEGLTHLAPEKGRLAKLPGKNGIIIIDDTYNASPISTLTAIEFLSKQPAKRRIVFLGDMLELGDKEMSSHIQVLSSAFEVADQVILVGSIFSFAAQQIAHHKSEQFITFETSGDVVMALKAGSIYYPEKGDCILVKGSASVRMEWIVQYLLSPEIDATSVLVRQESCWKDQ